MSNEENPIKKEQLIIPTSENKKGIENHQRTATHLEAGAFFHKEAAKYHETGNHEKAAECTIKAQGHVCSANELQREDVKHHAAMN